MTSRTIGAAVTKAHLPTVLGLLLVLLALLGVSAAHAAKKAKAADFFVVASLQASLLPDQESD